MKQPIGNPSPAPRAVALGTALQVLVVAIAVALLSLFIWVVYGVIRRGPEARAQVTAAQHAATAIMRSLQARSSVVPIGSRDESSQVRRGHTYLTQTQTFDAPGPFAATLDWHTDHLTSAGWRALERDEHNAKFAKERWRLLVEEYQVAELPPPACRYRIWLTWNN